MVCFSVELLQTTVTRVFLHIFIIGIIAGDVDRLIIAADTISYTKTKTLNAELNAAALLLFIAYYIAYTRLRALMWQYSVTIFISITGFLYRKCPGSVTRLQLMRY